MINLALYQLTLTSTGGPGVPWQAVINKKSPKHCPRLCRHNQPTETELTAHFSVHEAGSATKTEEMWWFYDPTTQTRSRCQLTGLLDWAETAATSDGLPCWALGRNSTWLQMPTGRDQHLDSQGLCWITIGCGRRWFIRKINWLFNKASRKQEHFSDGTVQE